MSKAGQNNFKGLNTQIKASLLIFLSNIGNYDFQSVVLEDKNWEDFTLRFTSNKKIICESKDWKKTLSWSDVKRIINKIKESKETFDFEKDQILIICNDVTLELEKNIEYLKYDFDEIKKIYIRNGFTDDEITYLRKISFYHIPRDKSGNDLLYNEALEFFYSYIQFWIPDSEIERFFDSILFKKFYLGSEKGSVFTKNDLSSEVELFKAEKIKNTGAFDSQKRNIQLQLKDILNAIDKSDYRFLIQGDHLVSLSAQPDLMFYIVDRIKRIDNLSLDKWEFLWNSLIKSLYSFTLLGIFKNNYKSFENSKYILKFGKENYSKLANKFLTNNHVQDFYLDLVIDVLKDFPDLHPQAFSLTKSVLDMRKTYKNLETRNETMQEREGISKIIFSIFEFYLGKKNSKQLDEIISLIDKYFDIVTDDGKYAFYTPPEIFNALREYIDFDFSSNFPKVNSIILNQFNSQKWYSGKFSGWEGMGGGISQSGNVFTIQDRHFVSMTLTPSLKKFYLENKKEAWKFITNKLITTANDNVSSKNPDFLNRAALPIIFNEYENGEYEKAAFLILANFIKMKGIPHKADLIFQLVRNSGMSSDKKWNLIKESLKAYNNLPINIFVEQITTDLAIEGNKEAIETVSFWSTNKDYNARTEIGTPNIVSNIIKLLNIKDTLKKGEELLETFINSKEFIDKEDSWGIYDVAKALTKVVEMDQEKGISLLQKILGYKNLSTNQQILFASAIEGLTDKALIKKVFDDVVSKELKRLGSIAGIEKRFPKYYARELIVQFAEELAKSGFLDNALWMVELFINDSNPSKSGEKEADDPEENFNYHKQIMNGEDQFTINTVRGWCCWVLQKFAPLQGRKYYAQIIPLVKKLSSDPNYYIRIQACVPLIDMMRNRHTVLPDNANERFISLELANKIEEIAFEMLRDKENHQLPSVMKHLGSVFSVDRTLNNNQASELLETYLKIASSIKVSQAEGLNFKKRELLPVDIIEEMSSLYIYYSEFRKDAYKKESFKNNFGEKMWTELNKFNDRPFKDILVKILKNGTDDIRAHFAWHFWTMPKEQYNFDTLFDISYNYLKILTEKYDHRTFESIYHFINDNLEKKFGECFDLWTRCVEIERTFFSANYVPEKMQEMYWWPYHYNSKILEKIYEKKGMDPFLKWAKILSEYPKGLMISHELTGVVEILKSGSKDNRLIDKIFDNLIERNPNYFEAKQEWQNKKRN